MDADCVIATEHGDVDALRAEVRDLKARLKAARKAVNPGGVTMDEWNLGKRALDLRVKRWRAK
jgi:hypothetical protein